MKKISFIFVSLMVFQLGAAIVPTPGQDDLLGGYIKNYTNKKELMELREKTLSLGGKAVPVLVKVMKSDRFPEKNRWIATFLLGQIMGEKAAPFVSKFLEHPHWILRMASLKTLLGLRQKTYGLHFAKMLKDDSLLVRGQALDNIRIMNLAEHAPKVWAMLYDERNYNQVDKRKKRTNIISQVIRTVGDLRFAKAQGPLLQMIRKKKYKDVFDDIDYSLQQLTGKQSPQGNQAVKRHFWDRVYIDQQVI